MSIGALERSWARVRRLAERYPDQWEGEDLEGGDVLRVFAGPQPPGSVLVVTKEAVLDRWDRSAWPPGLVVVIARGMITRGQARVIGALTTPNAGPIPFVGDADPMDLHAFLSLRAYLGARRIRFCGVCDSVLDLIGNEAVRPERLPKIRLSQFEREHMRVVKTFLDTKRILGPRVSGFLEAGAKIETELLARGGLEMVPAMFEAALRLARVSGRGARRPVRARI